jgi:hypothetical protein
MARKTFGFSLVALSLGLLLSGARLAKADTISVQVLAGPTGSGPYNWYYSTSLSGSGEIKAGDYVDVSAIPGFLSTSADNTTIVGADGTIWNLTYNLGAKEVEATYTGNENTVKGAIASLVNLPFVDSYGVDGGTALWGSDDHAAIGSNAGDPETPVTGQIVDAPTPPLSVPLPASTLGTTALFALALLVKAKKAVLA